MTCQGRWNRSDEPGSHLPPGLDRSDAETTATRLLGPVLLMQILIVVSSATMMAQRPTPAQRAAPAGRRVVEIAPTELQPFGTWHGSRVKPMRRSVPRDAR